jgi:ABC-type thiamin/hydroxymethylpyrimidine transport system permease subunit
METLSLSPSSLTTAGVLLLAIVTIEFGGAYVLKVVRGREPLTDFQLAFARAGHGHAGVLVILALVCQILVDAAHMSGLPEALAREGVPLAAILVSAGFFLSSIGRGATQPNRFIVVLYAGVALLGIGVASLGVGLLVA